jgi:hypothetical protein
MFEKIDSHHHQHKLSFLFVLATQIKTVVSVL